MTSSFARNASRRVRSWVALSVAALFWSPALSHRAHAYGGFWSSQQARVDAASAAIVFIDNPDDTVTAIIRIEYVGPPQQFAWVIPVPGKPTVGVSSNTLITRLDAITAPQYWVEATVDGKCKQEKHADGGLLGAASGTVGTVGAPDVHGAAAARVIVVDQGSAGPYDHATIEVDPTARDPGRLATEWFATNGYNLAGFGRDVLSQYLRGGFHLLAFKLRSDKDTGAIRPVVLTYVSKRPMIPIRPVAVAAQGEMGILVWVIGPSQAVPDNYKSLVLNDAQIDWLSGRKYNSGTLPSGGVGPFDPSYVSRPRNYDAVVRAAVGEAGGQGFVTELAAPVSRFRSLVWSSADEQAFASLSRQSFADGIDAIFAANGHFGRWDGWRDAIRGATTLPADVTFDDFAGSPDRYRGVAKVDIAKFLGLLEKDVIRPVSDTAAMLSRAPYLTRLYSRMSPEEMTVDPAFDYNADLALVSNIHIAKQFTRCRPSLHLPDAPWRLELPQGDVIAGKGSSWPVAQGSMPANLKIVQLSSTGSGTVLKDNADAIGGTLFQLAGTILRDGAPPHLPQNGLTIGGTQRVTLRGPAEWSPRTPSPVGSSKCAVSHVGACAGSTLARWLPAVAGFFALRRGRRARSNHRSLKGNPSETQHRDV